MPPDVLRRAAEIALADVTAPSGEPGTLSYEHLGDGQWLVHVCFRGAMTGCQVDATQDWADLVAALADLSSEALIDELWEAHPRCPLHEHPLLPIAVGGAAVWECPAGEWSAPIGSLATGGGPRDAPYA